MSSKESLGDIFSYIFALYDNLYEYIVDCALDYVNTLCIADYNSKVIFSGNITDKQACKDIMDEFVDYILNKSPNQELTHRIPEKYFAMEVESILDEDVEVLYGIHDISRLLAAACLLKTFGNVTNIDVLFVHSHYELAEEYGLEEVAPWSEYEYFIYDPASSYGFDVKTRTGSPLES